MRLYACSLLIFVGGTCAVIGAQNDQEERWICFGKSANQPYSRHRAIYSNQYSSSGTTAAALQALAFVHERVAGAQQQQEIEPQQH